MRNRVEPLGAVPIRWVGSSREDVRSLPRPVRRDIGQSAVCGAERRNGPSLRKGDLETGKAVLRDNVNATVGFQNLEKCIFRQKA